MSAAELASAVAALGARFDESVLQATRAIYAPRLKTWDGLVEQRDLAYGAHERHRLDLFRSAGTTGLRPIVLFVHGGGFVAGDKRGGEPFYANVGSYFAAHGYLAATMNYRLAPGHGWPAGGEDVASAVDWLAGQGASHGGDPAQLFVIGQSAGGGHVAGYLFDPQFRARARSRVRAAALMSGFYQANAPLAGGPLAYFGADAAQYEQRSPLSHVQGCEVPFLLSLAQFDPPALASQTLNLAGACTRANGQCPPMVWLEGHNHVSTVMSLGTEQDDAGRLLLDFFARMAAIPKS